MRKERATESKNERKSSIDKELKGHVNDPSKQHCDFDDNHHANDGLETWRTIRRRRKNRQKKATPTQPLTKKTEWPYSHGACFS
jgi:hypothetical protein